MRKLFAVTSAATQLPLFSEVDEPDSVSGFAVRESARARRLSIKVFPRGRVEIVVPRRTKAADVRQFVEANSEWIRKAREGFAAEHPPEPFSLPDAVALAGIGCEYGIRYRAERGADSVRFRRQGDTVLLSGRTSDESLCVAALKRWLTGVAREAYLPRLAALSSLTGNPFKKLHVRGQRTCWGSHSSTGTISLNYCLLFLEPEQLRYVMIHELCHARHMNHSRRFWNLVARYEPDYRRMDRELNSAWKKIPTWVGIY